MKKIITVFCIICACAFSVSCGSAEPAAMGAEPAVTETVDTTETAAIDKADFEVIPAEANASFDSVIEATKTTYPVDSGAKRQYGYRGKTTIDGKECYIFSVYNNEDDTHEKVGDFAKAISSDDIYYYNEASGEYEALEIVAPADEESTSWVNTVNANTVATQVKNATKLAVENANR